jgi:hypothetical protein
LVISVFSVLILAVNFTHIIVFYFDQEVEQIQFLQELYHTLPTILHFQSALWSMRQNLIDSDFFSKVSPQNINSAAIKGAEFTHAGNQRHNGPKHFTFQY